MRYILFFPFFLFFFQPEIKAQDNSAIKYGDVTVKDFILPQSSVVDSNTTGVIIANLGSVRFIGNKNRWFSYVFKKFTRIKVLNKSAVDDLGTLRIRLYGKDENKDQLTEIKASVYNLENGKVSKATISKSDIYEDKLNSFASESKIATPSVKEGSIIEYSYTITSNRYYGLPAWYFQSHQYPCLYSEYDIVFPDAIRYAVARYGTDPFYKDETSTVKDNKYILDNLTVLSNDIRRHWAIKDIPAFKEEKFIYSPGDYMDKVEFTLAQTFDGRGVQTDLASWASVTADLLAEPYFGEAIDKRKSANLVATVDKVTAGIQDKEESAKSIYYYIRDNFTCQPDDWIYLSDDLYDINKKKKGNVSDLNMLLIAMLRQKGVRADPVILSTREYGKNPADYPMLDKMNYVICMMTSFGDTIYLDASKPKLGYGQLSLDCYNGHARIISNDGGSIFFPTTAIKDQTMTTVFIVNEGAGILGGSYETGFENFKSELFRQEVKPEEVNKYFNRVLAEHTEGMEIMKTGIDSLSKPGLPIKVHFEFTIPAKDDVLYFNPVIITEYRQNPFVSENRKYPVSLPLPVNDFYTLNMQIPEGYVLDELPKSEKANFNGDQGSFEYIIQATPTNLQFRTSIHMNEVYYSPEDYQSLRDFFSFIIKKYNEQIVFKKQK